MKGPEFVKTGERTFREGVKGGGGREEKGSRGVSWKNERQAELLPDLPLTPIPPSGGLHLVRVVSVLVLILEGIDGVLAFCSGAVMV